MSINQLLFRKYANKTQSFGGDRTCLYVRNVHCRSYGRPSINHTLLFIKCHYSIVILVDTEIQIKISSFRQIESILFLRSYIGGNHIDAVEDLITALFKNGCGEMWS